ncbi:DUF4397 domain-containing protein [Pseudonocardia sp. GCM10023141]|uniref:DUF4397 domain-containing protein n=1 Tax=Pseudonocardia sp. GCM10023141 TaxID=3252653 RepID=UPI00360E6DC9
MTTASVLLPLLALTEVMRLINLVGTPQRIDDEGTYMAQAYAILHFGRVSPYTFFYDHPPLGSVQLAGWLWLSENLWGSTDAIATGRQFMVLAAVASAALLWVLVRRLGYGRFTAAAAVAVFALSPLAITLGRVVFLDNLSVMWLLAAAVCLCTPRRRLAAYLGAAVCFAVAVLAKETSLLLLPALAWLGWQRGDRSNRRLAMVAAGTLFTSLMAVYVVVAAVRGELLPGPGHPSLIDGIVYQLFTRPTGGSVFTAGSGNQDTLFGWIGLDGVLLAAGAVAALVALAVRGLRPLAFGFLLLAAMVVRGGFVPIPYVLVLIPLAALLVAGVATEAVRGLGSPVAWRKAVAIAALVVVAAAGGIALPRWHDTIDTLATSDADAPMRQARKWIIDNVAHRNRLIVDDALWTDLVDAGWKRDDVTWFSMLDTDPGVRAASPAGFRDYDFIVVTAAVRAAPAALTQVRSAVSESVTVATFGAADRRVDVRRINRSAAAGPAPLSVEPERATVGAALATRLGDAAVGAIPDLLRSGRVDARVLATLSDFPLGALKVADLPPIPGEDEAGLPRRQVLLAGPGAEGAVAYFKLQYGPFAAQSVAPGPAGVLVTFPPATAVGLLSAAVTPPASGAPAAVRVLDLIPGSGPVRVRFAGLDGTAIAPIGVGGYGTATGYSAVPAGVATLGVGSNDAAAPTAVVQAVKLAPGGSYTLMLFAGPAGSGPRGQFVADPATQGPAGRAMVRMVDGAAKAPGLSVATGTDDRLAQGVSYGLVTGYSELAPGAVVVKLSTGAKTSTTTVNLKAGTVGTLVVLDGADGPVLVGVDDPVRTPTGAPLATKAPARPGALTSAVATVAAPAAPQATLLGYVPVAVLGWGIIAAVVLLLLRRRRGVPVLATPAPGPVPMAGPPFAPVPPYAQQHHQRGPVPSGPVPMVRPLPPQGPGRQQVPIRHPVHPPAPVRPVPPPRPMPPVAPVPVPNRDENPTIMANAPMRPGPVDPLVDPDRTDVVDTKVALRIAATSEDERTRVIAVPPPITADPRSAPSPADVDPTVFLGSIAKLRRAAANVRRAEAEEARNEGRPQ